MSTYVIPANTRSDPIPAGANSIVQVTGSYSALDYTQNSIADIANGQATWTTLSLTSGRAIANEKILVRVITGATSVTISTISAATQDDKDVFITPVGVNSGGATNNVGGGQALTFTPQVADGHTPVSLVDTQAPVNPGEVFPNWVTGIGPNVNVQSFFNNTAFPFSSSVTQEFHYESPQFTALGVLQGGTTTTNAVVTGTPFQHDTLIGWTYNNITRGLSTLITANTQSAITHGAIAGQVAGDTIQLLRHDFEFYTQQAFWDGSLGYSFRPISYNVDKTTTLNQLRNVTITAATAANPPVFTTSGNHRFGDNTTSVQVSWVTFSNMTGGTWAGLNGRTFPIRWLSATTFTCDGLQQGSTLGVFTSGTCRALPTLLAAGIVCSSNYGYAIGTGSQTLVNFKPGLTEFFGDDNGDLVVSLRPIAAGVGTFGRNSILRMYSSSGNPGVSLSVAATDVNALSFINFDAAGANAKTGMYYSRAPVSGTGGGGALIIGGAFGRGGCVVANNNGGNGAGTDNFVAVQNAAATGDIFVSYLSDNVTKKVRIDSTGQIFGPGGTLIGSLTALTNNAAAQTATLTNAPVAGNPTKWIPINDNGTIRNIPAW